MFRASGRCLIAKWSTLTAWRAYPGIDAKASQFPLLPLASILRERKAELAPNLFGQYTPITVHLDGNISPRDRSKPYKGKMFSAYTGDVVFSKIDARNGAIGVIPQYIEKAVVTSEFPVFEPDGTKIDSRLVTLILKTSHFGDDLRRKATGTTGRKRITARDFLSLHIPVAALDQQREIVDAYEASVRDSDVLEQAAAKNREEAFEAFQAALGIGVRSYELPPMFIGNYRKTERWSPAGAGDTARYVTTVAKFPIDLLGNVGRVAYGLQKCPANRPGTHARPYLRVANVQRGFLNLSVMKKINVPDAEMPRFRLEPGDILLCEGNSAELVGRGAIWRGEIADCVHQNHVLRVRLRQDLAMPEFVLAVMNSSYGQAYFNHKAKRTTNLASINSTEVATFPIPLPPIDFQRALVAQLDDDMRHADQSHETAQRARDDAWRAFESTLYEADDTKTSLSLSGLTLPTARQQPHVAR